jgi:hypothetical protein
MSTSSGTKGYQRGCVNKLYRHGARSGVLINASREKTIMTYCGRYMRAYAATTQLQEH